VTSQQCATGRPAIYHWGPDLREVNPPASAVSEIVIQAIFDDDMQKRDVMAMTAT